MAEIKTNYGDRQPTDTVGARRPPVEKLQQWQAPECGMSVFTGVPPPGLLTYHHIDDMVFHMKTTLNISDVTMKRLKQEAARQGRTMSELVEIALRNLLRKPPPTEPLPPLPTFHGGKPRVNIADRNALYDFMEQTDDVGR
jgi:hypothetical protein